MLNASPLTVRGVAVAPDGTIYISNRGYFGSQTSDVVAYSGDTGGFNRSFSTYVSSGALAVDTVGNVYLAANGVMNVYPPGASSPPGTTVSLPPARSLNVTATAIALDAGANLYAIVPTGSSSVIKVYPPNASGNAPPIRTLYPPAGYTFNYLTIDPAGNLYVEASAAALPAIFVYAPGANGTALPSRAITGPDTKIDAGSSVAVDAKGYIYAYRGHSPGDVTAVLVFAPASSGDAFPISSSPITAPDSRGLNLLAVDPRVLVY